MYSVYASQEGSKEIIPGENMGTMSSNHSIGPSHLKMCKTGFSSDSTLYI